MARYKFKRRSSNFLDIKKQKNRYAKLIKMKKLTLGTIGVLFLENGLLEFKHILYIKRSIKKICKMKKKKQLRKARMKTKKKRKLSMKLFFLKKKFKKKKQKRFRLIKKRKKCWFFLFPNVVISSKSTNSRMGKGKGALQRWMIRAKSKLIFLRFLGFKFLALKNVFKKLQMRIPLLFHLFSNFTKSYRGYTYHSTQLFEKTRRLL